MLFRSETSARCRSFDCDPCKQFYKKHTNDLKINFLIKENEELKKENETLKKKVEFLHNQRDEILEDADCKFHTEDPENAKAEYMKDFNKEFGEL